MNIQLAAGCGHADRVENRHFKEHGRGVIGNTAALATHDPGQIIGTVGITDHQHGVIEGIGLLIEGFHLLTIMGQTDGQGIALDPVDVIGVQGAAQINHDVVGDIHQRGNRPLAHRGQTLLHPGGG